MNWSLWVASLDVPFTRKAVLFAIAAHATESTGLTQLEPRALRMAAGVSERTLRQELDECEARDYVVIERRSRRAWKFRLITAHPAGIEIDSLIAAGDAVMEPVPHAGADSLRESFLKDLEEKKETPIPPSELWWELAQPVIDSTGISPKPAQIKRVMSQHSVTHMEESIEALEDWWNDKKNAEIVAKRSGWWRTYSTFLRGDYRGRTNGATSVRGSSRRITPRSDEFDAYEGLQPGRDR
jgi:hypothetical protein